MAKEFYHNGEKVIYQDTIEQSFLDVLTKNGIKPVELPIDSTEFRVFRYFKDEKKRYAIVSSHGYDMYFEDIYLTDTVPEDGFEALFYDVTDQKDMNKKPAIMKSRIRMVLSIAREKADAYVTEKYNLNPGDLHYRSNADFDEEEDEEETTPGINYDEIDKERKFFMKMVMHEYGYTYEMLDQIYAPDAEDTIVREVLKDWSFV